MWISAEHLKAKPALRRVKRVTPVLPAMLALHLAVPAQAQAIAPRWIADAHDCKLWDLSPEDGETIRWSGACVDGYGEGRGVLIWYSGLAIVETDTASFHHGKLEGHVVMEMSNGERFEGEFHDHKPNGRGTLRMADGRIYSGEWTDGCFQDGKRRMNYGVEPRQCEFAS